MQEDIGFDVSLNMPFEKAEQTDVEAIDENFTLVRFANPAMMVQFVDNPDEPQLQDAARQAYHKICSIVDGLRPA